jgi:hypothetical protein
MEYNKHITRQIVLTILVWNDVYGLKQQPKLKKRIIGLLEEEGMEEPHQLFMKLQNTCVSMGTHIVIALDTYIKDPCENSIARMLERVCERMFREYPSKFSYNSTRWKKWIKWRDLNKDKTYQVYLQHLSKLENK